LIDLPVVLIATGGTFIVGWVMGYVTGRWTKG